MEDPNDETRVRFLEGKDMSPAELKDKMQEVSYFLLFTSLSEGEGWAFHLLSMKWFAYELVVCSCKDTHKFSFCAILVGNSIGRKRRTAIRKRINI